MCWVCELDEVFYRRKGERRKKNRKNKIKAGFQYGGFFFFFLER